MRPFEARHFVRDIMNVNRINSDLNALQKWAADWMINFNAIQNKIH